MREGKKKTTKVLLLPVKGERGEGGGGGVKKTKLLTVVVGGKEARMKNLKNVDGC